MPSKHTYAQDHWGYYNGLSNPTLIPNLDTRFFTGGDRRVKPDKVKVFSLKTITYPTGGKKEFIYEANTAKEGNLPHELKYQYQDDNFIENSAQILVRGESRSSYQPEADYMGTTGQRFYKKLFTVPANGYAYLGNGWHSSTNFGTTPSDISLGLTCQACYAKFTLYRVDDQGNRIFLRDHESVKCNSSGIPQERDGTDDAYVELMPGQYEMELQLLYNASNSGNNNQFHETDFTIKWREFDLTKRMLYVGGLRVKEIKAYSSENTLAQHKKYTYNDPYNSWSATSGQTIILPYYKTPMVKRTYTDLGGASGHYQSYFGFGFYADSRIPLETTSGSYAGYEYVTEETVAAGSSETLKTEYKFSFESPLYSQFYTSKNIGIYEAKEWSRGKLLNKKVFRGNSVIQEERYEYYIASPHLAGDNYEDYAAELNTNLISTIALNPMPWDEEDYVDWISFGPVYDQWGWYYSLDDFTVSSSLFASILPINLVKLNLGPFSTLNSYQARLPYFTKRTGFDKLKKKTTIINGDNNETLTKIENYYYERTPAHFELTKTETLDSKGNTNAITYKYPGDFASSSVIDAMLARRMINSIIEQKSYKAATLLTTQQNNYALWQSNAFVALSSMQSAQRSNALETEITVQEYDTKANLKRLIGRDGVTKSYLWDYNNYYPIAEITNASTTTIAATSFEADGTGGWTYSGSGTVDNTAPTGKMIFNLNGSNPISKTGLNQLTDYTISYWTNKGSAYAITGTRLGYPITGKTVNGWTYYEHRVVGSTSYTISGNGAIDELRFYPLITQMVTYTYEPLVGVKTQCDVNNRILYYEYDDIGRLVLIRDQDKNIVKRICYNYTGEPESCVLQQFTSAAFNANVTPNNCPPGQIASPVSVSVPAAQFTSYISLLDANQQAQAYAQQQANQQAVCFTPMYARIEYVPNWVDEHDAPDWEYYDEIVDVWIRFYTDAACTQPYTLTQNFNVNLFTSGMYEDDSGTSTTSNGFGVTILSGTNGKLLESELPLFGYNYFYDENHDLISLERWSASYLLNLNQASFIGIPPKYNGIVLPPWY
jgi:hypothetical protein